LPALNIQQHISLRHLNTFGIDVNADEYVEIKSIDEAKVLCRTFNLADRNLLILGGGSNVLFTGDVKGMVIRNLIKGIQVTAENDQHVWVKAMSGEVWHEFVLWTIEHNLGGLENLSLIPGCVGAAPMQNIGAYGVEVKNAVHEVEAIRIRDGKLTTFSNADCKFGYRESIFKQESKGKYILVSVTFRLNKQHTFNTSYGAIRQVLEKQGITNPTVKDVSDAVIEIRSSKLPNPKELGNAGSFFKNPEIPNEQYTALKEKYPELVGYPAANNSTKVAAGWLIEQCGWKGKRVGNAGSHKDQALVLVNYGGATGKEIWQLAMDIQQSVKDKFGITIVPEVNVI
jgi:UDP-N-acetylmuramate dehydrogenase